MKIRLFPVILTLVITLFLLFGGWWLSEQFLIKQPIGTQLDKEAWITGYEIRVTPKNVLIVLQVGKGFTLTGDYLVLLERMKEQFPRKNVTLTIQDNPNHLLQKKWNEMYFIMAEGIQQGKYHTMVQNLRQYPLGKHTQLQVAMDDERLYVWMVQTDEPGTLFQALPLHHPFRSEVEDIA